MSTLQRFCMTLDLQENPDLIGEYIDWHKKDQIWPEIPAGIRAAGIVEMEIYRIGNHLFMIIEADAGFDFKRNMEYLSHLPRQAEWEAFVSKYQKSDPGQTSKDKWQLMEKIFSLD